MAYTQARRGVRVLIAIPDTLARRRWRQGLAPRFRVQEVASRSALEHDVSRSRPDVLALDVKLLPVDGVAAVQRWCPSTRIVLLVDSLDEREAVAALKAGARGYCQRDGTGPLMRSAVRAAERNEIWSECPLIRHLLQELSLAEHRRQGLAPGNGAREALTSRERQIAAHIARGARNKEIAGLLHIAEATVKAHLTSIFRKLAVSDRLSLGLLLAEHNHNSRAPAGIRPRSAHQSRIDGHSGRR